MQIVPTSILLLSKQSFYFVCSYIDGTIPTALGNLVHLKELFLDDNELTGSIPSELGGLTNANYICLASNNLGTSSLVQCY